MHEFFQLQLFNLCREVLANLYYNRLDLRLCKYVALLYAMDYYFKISAGKFH